MNILLSFSCAVFTFISINAHNECAFKTLQPPIKIQIILGSTRDGRLSHRFAQTLFTSTTLQSNAIFEIVDLRNYKLPFLSDKIAPASRKEITDPQVKKFSEKIQEASAFIFIVPEYNGGYPGELKNALDSLYKEWNNKPVGFIGYSGGPSGGKSAVAQLRTVTKALEMHPIDDEILIPQSWKAFNEKGALVNKKIEEECAQLISTLISALATH